jgi:photosystem II stability/assembly factor-like uncharacterized protein
MILSLLNAAGAEARGNRWTSTGPDGGAAGSIAFGSVGSHAMYCIAGGEIFRSTDRGDSWTGTGVRNVFALAGSPGGGPVLFAIGDNIYRSDDSGVSWISTTPRPGNCFDGALAIDSEDANTVFAGFCPTLLRSTDGGGTWQETGLTSVFPVAAVADPKRPGVVYVTSPAQPVCPITCGYDVIGVWKSTDHGVSWAQPTGLPDDLFFAYALAIDPTNSDTIYAGCYGYVDGTTVFKSIDGGAHWAEADAGMNHLAGVSIVYAIAIDWNNSSTVYASSDHGVWKSTDGAGTWTLMDPRPRYANSIAVDPEDTSRIFVSDDHGLRRSLDGGRTWQDVNNGRPFVGIQCLSGDPTDARTVYAGTFDDGLYRTTDAGRSWLPVAGDLSFDSIKSISVDPFDRLRIYAALPSKGIYLSTDSGASWNNVQPPPGISCCTYEVTAVTGTSGLVYSTSTDGLSVSDDGGALWSRVTPNVFSVVPEQRRPGWLYGLGTGRDGLFVLLKSTNSGGDWSEIGPRQPGTNHRASLEAISLDPADPDVLYCGGGNLGFFVTRDGGQTWGNSPTVHATSITVLPGPQEKIFAGCPGYGVMESTDGGTTWSSINDGLRDLWVTSVLAAGGVVHAGTRSAGVSEALADPGHLAPITAPPPGRVGRR